MAAMNLRNDWKSNRRVGDWLLLANGLVLVWLINLMSSSFFFRLDLTEEKRYTIKPPTKALLENLDDDVYVEVFLEGDLNAQFRRFRKAIKEILEEFRIYSHNRVHYAFTNPAVAISEKAKNEFMADLASKGVQGMRVIDSKNGERIEKILFPGALVSTNGFEKGVMLLKGNRANGSQEVINQSIEGLEYELGSSIANLSRPARKRIGWIRGHGELDGLSVAGFNNSLLEQFDVFKVDLPEKTSIGNYDAVVIAKPMTRFSEVDKYKLDQYIMKGGKALFLIDRLDATMDSASLDNYFAFPVELNLDDQFFKYGVRINQNLVQDRVAAKYPVVIGAVSNKPQLMQIEWPFFPLVNTYFNHPITRNLDATLTRFVSSIDTVKAEGVSKTPLMFTSSYSRRIPSPVRISINDLREKPDPSKFSEGPIPIGYILEGRFTSVYKNRFAPRGVDTVGYLAKGMPSRIAVIADGDVARNDVNPRSGQPQALGYDPISGYTFANQDLLMNIMSYLTDDQGLISTRTKEIKIRPLDREKVKREKSAWQVINVAGPIALLLVMGLIKASVRRKKYAKSIQ